MTNEYFLGSSLDECARLQRRITRLLEANTAELERRRAVERDLELAKHDVQVWQASYHEKRELCERYERELANLERRQPQPFEDLRLKGVWVGGKFYTENKV